MYGAADVSELVAGEAPLVPLTPYAESKVRAEEGLAELADDDFSSVFMRHATIYGVSPRLRADVVLNNLVPWAFTTQRVKVLSDGTPYRPIVHSQDVARAALAVLQAPVEVIHNQAFNIRGKPRNYRVSEPAEIARDTVRGSTIEYAEGGGPYPRTYRVDFRRFSRAFPEYRPRWSARQGVRQLFDAFRQVDLRLETFQSHRSVRLAHLRLLIEKHELGEDLRWRQAADATS